MIDAQKIVWITWERHRRTRELSRVLSCELFELISQKRRIFRYCVLSVKTVVCIIQRRPSVLIVQSPSLVLALLASCLKPFFRYSLVIDAHNAGVYCDSKKFKIPQIIYIFCHRVASLVIVTNNLLKERVEKNGGEAFVLPDVLPVFTGFKKEILPAKFNALLICTFAEDEPFLDVVEAVASLEDEVFLYVTGKIENIPPELNVEQYNNIRFTGFLPERDYINLLYSSDAVIDLTLRDDCLVCGSYEAVALETPLILSDSIVNRELFGQGALFAENGVESIRTTIIEFLKEVDSLRKGVVKQKVEMLAEEKERVASLAKFINQCDSTERSSRQRC